MDQPNFLFIMTDQQRWDSLGSVKPENLKTPNIDALVEQGINFDNAYCQGPICIPSRASFLTGKYVHQHRLYHNNGTLPEFETTWGDVLKENGYETLSIGRTHTIQKGFEHIPVPIGDSYFSFPEIFHNKGEYVYGHDQCAVYPHEKKDFIEFRRTDIACKAIRDLKDKGRPFALFLGYLAPHNPYILPEPFASMYSASDFRSPRVCESDYLMPEYSDDHKRFLKIMDRSKTGEAIRYYYGMITMIDECIGQLLSTLENLGIDDNTIIIFTSDHGEMLGDHGRWAKGNIYEESVKIPLVIRNGKRISEGKTCSGFVESVDIFPTILDYSGVNLENFSFRLKGKSLRELIEDRNSAIRDAVFAELPSWIMVADENWKLGYGYPEDKKPYAPLHHKYNGILFDRKNDPFEQYNLFYDKSHKTVVEKLLRRIVDFHLDVKIPLHKDIEEIAFENFSVNPNPVI